MRPARGSTARSRVAVAQLATAGLAASAGSVLGVRTEGERRDPHRRGRPPTDRTSSARSRGCRPAQRAGEPAGRGHLGGRRPARARPAHERRGSRVRGAARPTRPGRPRRGCGGAAAGRRARWPSGSPPPAYSSATSYALTEDRKGSDVAGRLGVALGLSHHRVTGEKRLVDAITWVRGGPAQRRFDCLGTDDDRLLRIGSSGPRRRRPRARRAPLRPPRPGRPPERPRWRRRHRAAPVASEYSEPPPAVGPPPGWG